VLEVFTVILMLIVGYVYFVEGLFTAFVMFVNVLLAGIITFNFWEPIARALESSLATTFLAGYEDALVMIALFCISLALLRLVANNFNDHQIEYHPALHQGGGAVLGLVTGYLVSGFLVCVLQTLPWNESFMGFSAQASPESTIRRVLPADRVWLALMFRASAYPLSRSADRPTGEEFYDQCQTFDRQGSFELRYARYRRHKPPVPYHGEFDDELKQP
jgi:hypothetical protein